jgi:GNAT superfamily N-acetyltransferase
MVELVMLDALAVMPVRQAVLAPDAKSAPKRLFWDGDDEPRSMHLAVRDGKALVAAVSLFHDPVGEVGSEVWHVRGPLVVETQRRKGHARRLLQAVQAVVEKRGGGLWTRVPLPSLPFYSGEGFTASSDSGKGAEEMLLVWHPKP